jgi:hypothetical protein
LRKALTEPVERDLCARTAKRSAEPVDGFGPVAGRGGAGGRFEFIEACGKRGNDAKITYARIKPTGKRHGDPQETYYQLVNQRFGDLFHTIGPLATHKHSTSRLPAGREASASSPNFAAL